MKTLLVCCMLLLTSCAVFVSKKVSYAEELVVRDILATQQYELVSGSVEYYATNFEVAVYYYGRAYKNDVKGWFVISKDHNPPIIHWSETGDFPELDLENMVL